MSPLTLIRHGLFVFYDSIFTANKNGYGGAIYRRSPRVGEVVADPFDIFQRGGGACGELLRQRRSHPQAGVPRKSMI